MFGPEALPGLPVAVTVPAGAVVVAHIHRGNLGLLVPGYFPGLSIVRPPARSNGAPRSGSGRADDAGSLIGSGRCKKSLDI
jgi:hypothetical protein